MAREKWTKEYFKVQRLLAYFTLQDKYFESNNIPSDAEIATMLIKKKRSGETK